MPRCPICVHAGTQGIVGGRVIEIRGSTSGAPPKRIGHGSKEGETVQRDSVRHLFDFRRVLVNCNCPTRIERHHRWPVEFEARLVMKSSWT